MSIAGVTRELLVRYLDTWVLTALHSARRITYLQAWSARADVDGAEASLRVFAEFADHMRGRSATLVFLAPDTGGLADRLDAVQAELALPVRVGVHVVTGTPGTHLSAALAAAGAAGAPVLAHLETDESVPLGAVAAGHPAEVLIVTGTPQMAGTPDLTGHGRAIRKAGFPLVACVEFVAGPDAQVAGPDARLVIFGTPSVRSLEAFKNALWQVDEYVGVRIRDPFDPDAHLMDISLTPNPGLLRQQLLTHLARIGESTVSDLRQFTLTDTVYRAADATRVLTALLATGTVIRRPHPGRLSGDVIIALAGRAPRP